MKFFFRALCSVFSSLFFSFLLFFLFFLRFSFLPVLSSLGCIGKNSEVMWKLSLLALGSVLHWGGKYMLIQTRLQLPKLVQFAKGRPPGGIGKNCKFLSLGFPKHLFKQQEKLRVSKKPSLLNHYGLVVAYLLPYLQKVLTLDLKSQQKNHHLPS